MPEIADFFWWIIVAYVVACGAATSVCCMVGWQVHKRRIAHDHAAVDPAPQFYRRSGGHFQS